MTSSSYYYVLLATIAIPIYFGNSYALPVTFLLIFRDGRLTSFSVAWYSRNQLGILLKIGTLRHEIRYKNVSLTNRNEGPRLMSISASNNTAYQSFIYARCFASNPMIATRVIIYPISETVAEAIENGEMRDFLCPSNPRNPVVSC